MAGRKRGPEDGSGSRLGSLVIEKFVLVDRKKVIHGQMVTLFRSSGGVRLYDALQAFNVKAGGVFDLGVSLVYVEPSTTETRQEMGENLLSRRDLSLILDNRFREIKGGNNLFAGSQYWPNQIEFKLLRRGNSSRTDAPASGDIIVTVTPYGVGVNGKRAVGFQNILASVEASK